MPLKAQTCHPSATAGSIVGFPSRVAMRSVGHHYQSSTCRITPCRPRRNSTMCWISPDATRHQGKAGHHSSQQCYKQQSSELKHVLLHLPCSVAQAAVTNRCAEETENSGEQNVLDSVWRKVGTTAAAAAMAAALVASGPVYADDGREPSVVPLEITKPRASLIIQESQTDRDNFDFSHQDLTEALFAETSLKYADLNGSDMRGAVFSRALLYHANLTNVDASFAVFDYALLRGSNVRGGVFANANFIRADMGEMDVTDADFTDALIDNYELQDLCQTASGTNPYTGVDTRDSLNCSSVKYYKGFNQGNRIVPK